MGNERLTEIINYWDSYITTYGSGDGKIFELAFFKMFVAFELFLSEIFVEYSLGKQSSNSYKPKRKLGFKTKKQLDNILLGGLNNRYVDYVDKIQKLSKEIYKDGDDPFTLIFDDASFSNYYKEMQHIRNFIAHESEYAKRKYITVVLKNRPFEQVHEHLLRVNSRNSKTYYTIYVEKMIAMSEIIINPSSYL